MKKHWLKDKTIVISGASGGLGFAVAKLLIKKYNCKIIGIARNEKKLLSSIETLGDKKDNFSYRLFDVSIRDNWVNFKNYLEENNIQVDMLINNAGFMLPFARFDKYSDEEVTEIINTNFTSVINATKIMLPLIKRSSTPAIVNVSSAAGIAAIVGQSMYCATKFAVRGFTEALQQDYKKKIYIGGIYPGFIKTDILNRQTISDKENKLINMLMKPLDKAAKKFVRRIAKKRRRTVMGFDGHLMSIFGRLFPKLTAGLIRKVLKITKLQLFKDVFD